MRVGASLVLVAAVLLAATGVVAAADNTAPLADAGVDQTVPVNATVYLDANGSTDPDGEITRVEWSIETPSGATTTPDCADCRRTAFDATALGQYTVTLTVTDDDGATRSDTLYVTTTTEDGPDVSVSGPTSTPPGSDATFTATVSAENATLQTLTWLVDGSVVQRESLDGASATTDFTHSVETNSTVPVRVVVYDTLGNRGSGTHRLSVASSAGGGADGGSSSSGCYDQLCGDGADKRYTYDGQTYVADTNNKDGIQTYQDGRLITIENPTESPKISEANSGGYTVDGRLSDVRTESLDTSYEEAVIEPNDDTSAGLGDSNDNSGGSSGGNWAENVVKDTFGDELDGTSEDEVESNTPAEVNDDGSVSMFGITVGGTDDDDSSDGSSSDDDDSGDDGSSDDDDSGDEGSSGDGGFAGGGGGGFGGLF